MNNHHSTLRDYQEQAARAVCESWKKHDSTMVVLPTGCGKTVLFAEIIRRRQPGRSLVLAHREELIYQARDKIERFAGIDCEIEMADKVAAQSLFHRQPVVVATIQTLISGRRRRRMERFQPEDFSTVVIDEFHHSTAASYRAVLDYFRQNPQLKVLGVTATPDRADEEALGQVCDSVAFHYDLPSAVEDGWLCPIEQQMVTIGGLDFSGVRTTAGDLNGADLAAIMETEKAMQGLCSATLDIIGRRQTIVFTASVRHAEMCCNIFNRHQAGIADWVCGKTDKETRRKRMAAVVSGQTQILCNVGVATEGFDAPGVEVIVMGRPTKSRALYAQMAGRATRPLPGVVDGPPTPEARRAAIAASRKPACLLVDFVGNSGRHKLITGLDLLGGKHSPETQERARELMERDGGPRRITQALADAEHELEEERRKYLEQLERERQRRREEAEARRQAEEARKARIIAHATYSARAVSPFDVFDIRPVTAATAAAGSDRRYEGCKLSPKQRDLLRKQGIDADSLPYAEARQLLDTIFTRWNENLCSLKQATILKRFGYDHAAQMTRDQAAQLITLLKANGWRRPQIGG